jgi:hypothetical protein
MPLGNGDIGLNVWTEPESGSLMFYVSKVDAFDGRGLLPKLGKLRLTLTPNPFAFGNRFRQELKLTDGVIEIESGAGAAKTSIRLWVDANRPVIRVTVQASVPVDAMIAADWVRARPYGVSGPDAADQANSRLPGLKLDDQQDRLVWAFRNNASTWKAQLIAQKQQEFAEKAHDPLLNLTSGCLVKGPGFVRAQAADSLQLKEKSRTFDFSVHVLGCQTDKASEWFSRIEKQAVESEKVDPAASFAAHREWWHSFWARSYISVEVCGDKPVRLDGYRFTQYPETFHEYVKGQVLDPATNALQLTQRYALERFLQACAGRSSVPPPFNGSIFTMDMPIGTHAFIRPREKASDANSRDWGLLPFFWQNTRHPGWSMLTRGDYDTMMPSFRLIRDSLDLSKDRARQWFGHDGAFMPEGIIPGGVSVFTQFPGHLTYHWLGTIEMTTMMCDYFEHTQDQNFLKEILLPCADEFIKFYELHFPKREGNGRMIMEPAGVAETYQPVTNPVTEVSGLRYLVEKLLSFDQTLVGETRRAYWKKMLEILPAVPSRTVNGLRLLAPGETYKGRLICETPELYAVWPFRQAWLGSDPEALACARQSFHVRQISLDGTPDSQSWETGGWQSAPIWAAALGLPREAARLVTINFDDRFPNIAPNPKMVPPVPGHPRARFPGFWETKMDYTPDNDHGAVSVNALQSMVLQNDGRRIFLLPAWPEDWDVSFKLRAAFDTTVECVYRDGRVQDLKVVPESRRADVVDLSSFENRIRTIVTVACTDRNYLFGLPPMLDGLPQAGVTTGAWLKKYGECLEGVRAAPWPNGVYRGKTLYMFDLTGGKPQSPQVPATLISSTLLTEQDKTPVGILKLEYDRPLDALALAAVSQGSVTAGRNLVNGEMDLGTPQRFDRVEFVINNPEHRRGQGGKFSLRIKQEDGTWTNICGGAVYGNILSQRFEPVLARQVRLEVKEPVLRFDLFAPEQGK